MEERVNDGHAPGGDEEGAGREPVTRPLRGLSDGALIAQFEELIRQDDRHLSDVLLNVGEVDERRLYLGKGYSSMFRYCVEGLHRSEDVASNHIRAARAALRFPVILKMVERGEVHLAALRLVAPHLTPENHEALLGD